MCVLQSSALLVHDGTATVQYSHVDLHVRHTESAGTVAVRLRTSCSSCPACLIRIQSSQIRPIECALRKCVCVFFYLEKLCLPYTILLADSSISEFKPCAMCAVNTPLGDYHHKFHELNSWQNVHPISGPK